MLLTSRLFMLFSFFILLSCHNNDDIEDNDSQQNMKQIIDNTAQNIIELHINNSVIKCIEEIVLFRNNLYRPIFRIPSIMITNQGSYLLSCENRQSIEDKGKIDLIITKKEKNSSLWTSSVIYRHNSTNGRAMNPVFLIDRVGAHDYIGRIYLFSCHIVDNVYAFNSTTKNTDFVYRYSDDDGNNWSKEYSLKHLWNDDEYTAVIPSASNGIQLLDGTLLLPTMVIKNATYRSGLLIKRPNEDWKFSSPSPIDGDNECTVYTDNHNNIILDCRTFSTLRHKYVYDLVTDTYSMMSSNFNVGVALKAEVTRMEFEGTNIYLSSFPNTTSNKRENLSLWASKDSHDWEIITQFKKGSVDGAYSNVYYYNNQLVLTYETMKDIRVIDLSPILNDIKLHFK